MYKKWHYENPEKVLASRRKWQLNNCFVYRYQILKLLGVICKNCGYDKDWRALHIDHVNGNGKRDRKTNSGTYYKKIKQKILKGSKEYQILCANCNWIKVYENKERKFISQEILKSPRSPN